MLGGSAVRRMTLRIPISITREINIFAVVHFNQDLIRCVKRGVYMGFWVYRGS